MPQTRAQIKSNIDSNITTNGQEEITGAILRNVLNNMADNLAIQQDIDNIEDDINTNYTKSVDIPVEKGTGENSVQQKGTGAIAMSEASFAIGAATHSGTKGFRWTSWDKASLTFTLEKALPKAISNDTWLSIVNDSHYDKCCQVDGNVSAGSTTIKVKTSPFDSKVEGDIGYDAYIIMVVDDPTIGDIDLGQTAYAEGGNTKALQMFSHAEGYGTEALGQYSHTEGRENKAVYAAHAEGRGTEAMGNYSHTEGQTTKAYGGKSHAEGTQTETYANNSHTEGFRDIIKDGAGAHAEGYGNVIDITENTAVTTTTATGQSIGAHAEGVSNKVAGIGAHAEGRGNIVNEEAAHVEGKNNIASGRASHAEGFTTRAGNLDAPTEQTTATEGWFAHAEGNSTFAKGNASHAEGAGTKALARAAHAEGRHSIALGNYSHAEGFDVMAGKPTDDVPQPTTIINETEGFFAHAEGHHTLAKGNSSHAEGKNTEAAGIGSHAEGYGESKRDGSDIVASNIIARGKGAHAEGCAKCLQEDGLVRTYILAEGDGAHAEGCVGDDVNSVVNIIAHGVGAHAEGIATSALADGAHAEGRETEAKNRFEHAEGHYNKSNKVSGAYGNAGNTQHSVGIGTSVNNRKNAFEVMQNGDHYVIGLGGYDGTNPDSAKTLQQVISECGSMTEITYSALKSLRDNSQLIPGMQYRITDYVTTTVRSNTQSAGHQFDIIVVANDNHTLNENAMAILHSGDTYFSGSALEAWELKYDLNNDTVKYIWADSTNGKGVIYYMKDEWNNECPYDFKNIQFKRWAITDITGTERLNADELTALKENFVYDTNGSVCLSYSNYNIKRGHITFIVDGETSQWCYTFGFSRDTSLTGDSFNNIIEGRRFGKYLFLESNVIYGHDNIIKADSYGNTFWHCEKTILSNSCSFNIFAGECYNNTFGNECINNIFGAGCSNNTFKSYCSSNLFGNNCSGNTFGHGCHDNTFELNCNKNTFGTYCSLIKFYRGKNVVLGNNCKNIEIIKRDGERFEGVTIGNHNYNITLSLAGNGTSSSNIYIEDFFNTEFAPHCTIFHKPELVVGQTEEVRKIYRRASTHIVDVPDYEDYQPDSSNNNVLGVI